MFSRVAPDYGRIGPPFFSHFGRRLVEVAEIPEDARVLDIASGAGAVLFAAAERVGPKGQVIGIDLAEGMVRQASKEIHRLGVRNAEATQMDAEELAFPDASFDFVLCGFSLFFFPGLDRALLECRRVLRPQGIIAVSTFGEDDRLWKCLDELAEAYEPEMEPMCQANTRALDTAGELKEVLSQAGFIDIQILSEEEEFVYKDEDEWWRSLWSLAWRALLESMEPSVLQRFKVDAFDMIQPLKRSDGLPDLMRVLFAVATTPQR